MPANDIMAHVVASCDDPKEAAKLLRRKHLLTPAEIRKLEAVAKRG
jgi:hypothetical protein